MNALADMQLPSLAAMVPELYLAVSAVIFLLHGAYRQPLASKVKRISFGVSRTRIGLAVGKALRIMNLWW